MVAAGGGNIDDGLDVQEDGDEATRRRELRLLKNKSVFMSSLYIFIFCLSRSVG